MRHHYQVIHRQDLSRDELKQLARYRYQVFVERLGWQLPCDQEAGEELDQFDELADVHYVLRWDPTGRITGCARLMPAEGPSVSRMLFPDLFTYRPLPTKLGAWELSRLAADRDSGDIVSGVIALLDVVLSFAEQKEITDLYGVTYAAMQTSWARMGFDIEPAGETTESDRHRILGCHMKVTPSLKRAGFRRPTTITVCHL